MPVTPDTARPPLTDGDLRLVESVCVPTCPCCRLSRRLVDEVRRLKAMWDCPKCKFYVESGRKKGCPFCTVEVLQGLAARVTPEMLEHVTSLLGGALPPTHAGEALALLRDLKEAAGG